MMADEPTLPSLGSSSLSQPDIPCTRPYKRLRLSSTSPPISSDPPLFSSDDDPSADNYGASRGRSKKQFVGPWFSQRPREQRVSNQRNQSKRTLQRQVDSAVWLGSDGTEADSDAEFSKSALLPTPTSSQRTLEIRAPRMVTRAKVTPEDLARAHIELCLENSKENIDLSALGLTQLKNSAIKPLSTFVLSPPIAEGVEFRTLQPSLKLFLASNQLHRIPGEICNLERLKVLTLRANQLQELPAAIGKMHNLVELNVSNNRLRTLPYEFLELLSDESRLRALHLHPNKFYETGVEIADMIPQPVPGMKIGLGSKHIKPQALLCIGPERPHSWSSFWSPKYRCRSRVRFLNAHGSLLLGPSFPKNMSLFTPANSAFPRKSTPIYRDSVAVAPEGDLPESPDPALSRTPSLFEVAAKAYSDSSDPSHPNEWLEGLLPAHLLQTVRDADSLKEMEAGARSCTVCKREFVIPRTEWIEWWEIAQARNDQSTTSAASPLRDTENRRDEVEKMIPLMRRGCSWSCVPEIVQWLHAEGEVTS